MYERHWGLRQSPFHPAVGESPFFEGPIHEEALARLLFLVEQQRSFGLLTGHAGTGKSELLSQLMCQVQRTQRKIISVDLFGLDGEELLWQLADTLKLVPKHNDSRMTLWRSIRDHLTGMRLAGLQTVFIFDQLERASTDCIGTLERLLHLDAAAGGCLTTIVASQNGCTVLSRLADLQITVSEFDSVQTAEFIRSAIRQCGAQQEIFTHAALERIHEETAGIPRDINRLCDFCLLSAMSAGDDLVDVETVAAAVNELPGRLLKFAEGPVGLRPMRSDRDQADVELATDRISESIRYGDPNYETYRLQH